MMYDINAVVPTMIDGFSNVQPFNAMLVIISPDICIGSNFDSTCKNFGCPSKGHNRPKQYKITI